jgi:hypothetical protein
MELQTIHLILINTKRYILLLVIPFLYSSSLAGTLSSTVKLNYLNGTSSYDVYQNDLKATLIFPYKVYTLDIGLSYLHKDINYYGGYSTSLKAKDTMGEDFDWKNNTPTVYSSSKNVLKDYSKIEFDISKRWNEQILYGFNYRYKEYFFVWYDTNQIDYISNSKDSLKGETLKYTQYIYDMSIYIGVDIIKNDKYNLVLTPSINYLYVDSKDEHILRNFYTKQENKLYSYKLLIHNKFNINKNCYVFMDYSYQQFSDDSTMDFFNNDNILYKSLNAAIELKEQKVSFGINYKFD